MKKNVIIILLTFCFQFSAFSANDSIFIEKKLHSLSLREKIAQLITIRSYGNRDEEYYKGIEHQIKKYKFGGICFFKSTPEGYAKAYNRYQKATKIPILMSIDGEWGVAMRVDGVTAFPFNQTLGAVQNDELVYRVGEYVGEQCNRMGVHWNFAPCVDVNSNPNNPVINYRSFGEDAYNVARKSLAYMQGLHSKGVMSSAKHFPGHGDTDMDSHFDLPSINKSKEEIQNVDLVPYKVLINNGLSSVMVAHLLVPAYDTAKFSSTVSKMIVDTLLKQVLGYKGLIVSDGMEMKGFYKNGSLENLEVKVLEAGIDVILVPVNPIQSIDYIEKAVKKNIISEELINEKCRKILKIKKELGLFDGDNFIEEKNIQQELNLQKYNELNAEIYKYAITLLRNRGVLPIHLEQSKKTAFLHLSTQNTSYIKENLSVFDIAADEYYFNDSLNNAADVLKKLSKYDLVIATFTNGSTNASKNYGLSKNMLQLLEGIAKQDSKFIFWDFANPYSIKNLNTEEIDALIIAYQSNKYAIDAVFEAIFGKIDFQGKLPVTISGKYPVNYGLSNFDRILNHFEQNNFDFHKVDSLINWCISDSVFPSCQVLFSKNGRILYNNSFKHIFSKDTLGISSENLYDIASVTKIVATTLAMMKLYDEGKYALDDSVSQYLTWLQGTDKQRITFRQVLAHQAGLTSSLSLPFDSVKSAIVCSKMHSEPYQYHYSDVGFIILGLFIEKITDTKLDKYVAEQFYTPLGLKKMTFLPNASQFIIAPTEKNMSIPTVHDPTVKMMGGVGGSAGVFSNAEDIAIVLQMLLNQGIYNGKRYIEASTVDLFTSRILPELGNRRGAGFDKPYPEYDENKSPCAESASLASFGHSGFTGCLVWADPNKDMIYVFLSNRIYPDQNNNKITKYNIRPALQQLFYNITVDD